MTLKNRSMLNGPILPAILSYAVPVILTNFLQLAFNSADMIIVGQYCGTTSFAAVSATAQIINLLVILFSGFATGVGVAVAQAIGSRNDDDLHCTVHTAVPTAILFGLILVVTGQLIAKPFLVMLGTPESIIPLSTLYLRIYFIGVPFSLVYNYCAAILRASGDTKSPLTFLGAAGVVNIGLNIVLVTVFEMNVSGVALATVISNGLSAVLALNALMNREDGCKFLIGKMHIHPGPFKKIIRIGLPAGIQGTMYGVANLFIQSSINSFGEVFISGSAAAGNIEAYVFHSVTGFTQASVDFVGQNYGARNFKRIWKVTKCCLICVLIVGSVFGQLAYLLRYPLLTLFVPNSPEAIEYGMIRISIISTSYFLCAMVDVTTGALRGMGASLTPMIISALCICGIRVSWIMTVFQIPKYHTPEYLYLCFPVSWVIMILIQFTLFFAIFRRKKRNLSC